MISRGVTHRRAFCCAVPRMQTTVIVQIDYGRLLLTFVAALAIICIALRLAHWCSRPQALNNAPPNDEPPPDEPERISFAM